MTDEDNDNNEKEPEEMIPYYFSNWKKMNFYINLENRTIDSVRQILSEDSACIDVRKREKEQSLLIIDGLKGYFGLPNGLMSFTKQLAEYAKTSDKNCVSIIGDMGPFFYNRKKDNLIGWELELPFRYHPSMKGFCVYHEKDFDRRLAENDKELLFGHHEQVLDLAA